MQSLPSGRYDRQRGVKPTALKSRAGRGRLLMERDSLLAIQCRTFILSISQGYSKQDIFHFVHNYGLEGRDDGKGAGDREHEKSDSSRLKAGFVG